MPNWVTNRIRIKGSQEELEAILKQHIVKFTRKDGSEDEYFDFNTVIPEPQLEEDCPPEYRIDKTYRVSIERSESRPWFDWYSWRCSKWGTKWNSSDTQICGEPMDGEIEIWFETAWSAAYPIYERFAMMHPTLEIEAAYVEEQGPEYTGRTRFKGGEVVEDEAPDPGSKRAHEIMFDLWGNGDDYKYNAETDNYDYIEDKVVDMSEGEDETEGGK